MSVVLLQSGTSVVSENPAGRDSFLHDHNRENPFFKEHYAAVEWYSQVL